MHNRIVCITGASRGIGRAISQTLALAGATVVMLARNITTLQGAVDEIGPAAVAIATDICDPDAVRTAFGVINERFGRLDVLINNAGSSPLRRIADLSDAEIGQTIGTNFTGAVYCTRSAIPLLCASGGGDIINISSESSTTPLPYLGLYAASKAGLEAFTLATQAEVKADGTRVTTLVCGATDTEWARDWDSSELRAFLDAATASGHLTAISAGQPQQPNDVAEVVRFVLTRPRGQVLDVVHVRAHNNAELPQLKI